LRFDLQTCLNNIFSEAEFRGTFSTADIWTAFENPQEKDSVLKMISDSGDTFRKLWQSIGFNDPMETFGEVSSQPFAKADEILLETGLVELQQMNSDFLEMAAVRLQALIQREVGGSKMSPKVHGRMTGIANTDASNIPVASVRAPARTGRSSPSPQLVAVDDGARIARHVV
jgi:hypothetical protein